MKKTIVYLGNNDLTVYKRGVENVIWFQSRNKVFNRTIYIALCDKNKVCHWNDFICIYIKRDWKCYYKLNKVIFYLNKKYGHVFIHSHSPVLSCALYCMTDLLTVHDAIYYQRKSHKQWNYPVFAIVEYFSAFRVKHIHYISKFTRENSLLKNIFKRKSTLIYNTTPLELLEYNDVSLDISGEEISVFTVRGIQERNKIDLLYDLAKGCQNLFIKGKKIHFYIAGKGPLLEKYKIMCKEENVSNISFLGFISDLELVNYYKKCDLVIVVTEFAEGFGLPIIEGYLYNKPVVASNKCAIPEVIINKKYLFDNNVTSIIDTIQLSLDCHDNYLDFYNRSFANKVIIKRYDDLYSTLCSHH